jgi:hypothetical protein
MTPKRLSHFCERCGRELRLGATSYNLFMEIASGFDGYLPETTSEDNIDRVVEEATALDEETLEGQVHLEISLLICPLCRKDILSCVAGEDGALTGAKRKARSRLQ